MEDLTILTWPLSRIGEALRLIGEKSGLSPKAGEIPLAPKGAEDKEESASEWIEEVARWMGLEAEPTKVRYEEVKTFIRRAAPALIRLPGEGPAGFLALFGHKKKKALMLGTDGIMYPLETSRMAKILGGPLEQRLAPQIENLLLKTNIPQKKKARVKQALLSGHLSSLPLRGYWLLRLSPSRSFLKSLLQAKILFPFLVFFLVHTGQYLLWILSWWGIGKGALEGHLHPEWVLGWGAPSFEPGTSQGFGDLG